MGCRGTSGGPVSSARAVVSRVLGLLILPCGLVGFRGSALQAGLLGSFDLDDPTVVDCEKDLAIAEPAQLFLNHFDPIVVISSHIRLKRSLLRSKKLNPFSIDALKGQQFPG